MKPALVIILLLAILNCNAQNKTEPVKNSKPTECINKDTVKLADGIYDAVWGGYYLTVTIGGKETEIEIKKGVRGFNVPAKIKVVKGCIISMDY